MIALAATTMAGSVNAAPIIGLYNTGTDNSNAALGGGDGVVDTHYTVVETGEQARTYYTGSYAANTASSRWIAVDNQGSLGAGLANTSTYRLSFDLTGYNHLTAQISGLAASDDAGVIFLNGVNTGITFNGYAGLTSFSLASGFIAGINTLDFQVTDLFGPPTALRVENLVGSISSIITGVPEPTTWAMMLAGFALMGGALRRKRPEVRLRFNQA